MNTINEIYKKLEEIQHLPTFRNLIETDLSKFYHFPSRLLINLSSTYFANRQYNPESKGQLKLRSSITKLYTKVSHLAENIFVTASTSESYQVIFNVLKFDNTRVLLPRPTYPLFDYLAKFSNIEIDYYDLIYDDENGWTVDIDSLVKQIKDGSRFLVIISPNNPTGSSVEKKIFDDVCKIAVEKNLIVIVDEVFSIFQEEFLSTGRNPTLYDDVLSSNYPNLKVFFLNGISKMFALPDLKIAWFVGVNLSQIDKEAFEIYLDTFLNANYLAQDIITNLINSSESLTFQRDMVVSILSKSQSLHNHGYIKKANTSLQIEDLKLDSNESIKILNANSGIHRVLNISNTRFKEEDYVLKLLDEKKIFVHPGYFYEIPREPNEVNIVMSLL